MVINRILFCFLIILAGSHSLKAQFYDPETYETESESGKPYKLGIKAGFTPTWIEAPNMQNNKVQIGLQGGFYYRWNFNRKRLHLQTELTAAFKGAKFANSESEYKRLSLFYMDVPVYLMLSLDDKHSHNVLFGPVISYLVRPGFYIGNELNPSFTHMPLKDFDFGLSAAYLKSFDMVGLSLAMKFGLRNIAQYNLADYTSAASGGTNTSIYLKDINPSLNGVDFIRNLSLEFSILF